MNPELSKEEEKELVNKFVESFSSLPRDLLVNVGFATALRDLLSAIQIAASIGIIIAQPDQERRLQEGVKNVARLGQFMRAEDISSEDKTSFRQLYTDLVQDIRQIESIVIANQESLASNEITKLGVCSIESGCSAPEAIKLLRLVDQNAFDHIANLANWISNRLMTR